VSTVNNGTVTTNAAGMATITAATYDGNYTADCLVTVTETPSSSNGDTEDSSVY
jgi:uncharacterized protein YjdB